MKLSDLVAFRNQLAKLDIDQARDHTRLDLGQFKYLIDDNFIKVGQYQEQVTEQYNLILNQISHFGSIVDSLKHEILGLIEETEKPYFVES